MGGGGVVLTLADVDAEVKLRESVAGDGGGPIGFGRLGDEGALVLLGVESLAVEVAFGGEECGADAGAFRGGGEEALEDKGGLAGDAANWR
jgi:hypothetical protein